MRSRYIPRADMAHLLAGCMPQNAEALRLSLDYGVRIGDVLRMPIEAAKTGRWSFKEEKTGKRRIVKLSEAHRQALLSFGGKIYAFEHRLDPHKHRTRQAVYKDLTRIAKAFRLAQVTPHSARKIYAVQALERFGGDVERVQHLLNHSSAAVTMLYCYADQLSERRRKETKR